MADDAVDLGHDRRLAIGDLRVRLDRIYAGEPGDAAADRAFAACVARHGIPKRLPQAMLEGFEWDADMRRYATLAELRAYAVRVAGTVGVMMAMIMGVRDQRTLARACDLGVAMQLTNIARDVGEDARAGRLYLPLDWLREANIDAREFLARPRFDSAMAKVVSRLLSEADRLYVRSETGIAQLPVACRPAMLAARLLYAEIGNQLRRSSCDSVNTRAVVSARRKAAVLAAACVGYRKRPPAPRMRHALAEAEFILRSFPAARRAPPSTSGPRATESRVAWLLDLFERLERSERVQHNTRRAAPN